MVLDDKGAVKAERFRLDIVLDPLAEALTAVGQFRAWRRPPRLGAAEKSKPHGPSPNSPSPPSGAERVGVRWGIPERLPTPTSPSRACGAGPSLSALKGGEGSRSNLAWNG